MFESPIKSRPRYAGLAPVAAARRHLIAAEGEGAAAVLRLAAGAPAGFAARAEVVYAATVSRAGGFKAGDAAERLRALGLDRLQCVANVPEALIALDRRLAEATMGTHLYAAGMEGFVGQVIRLGIDHGIDHRSVVTEHSGSLARRVQCVHCKRFTDDVTTSIFECGHCANLLFVRDHYSRRLAAFQGVCVNAEDKSVRPPAEELYR